MTSSFRFISGSRPSRTSAWWLLSAISLLHSNSSLSRHGFSFKFVSFACVSFATKLRFVIQIDPLRNLIFPNSWMPHPSSYPTLNTRRVCRLVNLPKFDGITSSLPHIFRSRCLRLIKFFKPGGNSRSSSQFISLGVCEAKSLQIPPGSR